MVKTNALGFLLYLVGSVGALMLAGLVLHLMN
jgi:hypothetical protein